MIVMTLMMKKSKVELTRQSIDGENTFNYEENADNDNDCDKLWRASSIRDNQAHSIDDEDDYDLVLRTMAKLMTARRLLMTIMTMMTTMMTMMTMISTMMTTVMTMIGTKSNAELASGSIRDNQAHSIDGIMSSNKSPDFYCWSRCEVRQRLAKSDILLTFLATLGKELQKVRSKYLL